MSDREFERALSDWLESGSDRTPPQAIDAVLLAAKTTPQERDFRIPWRTPRMTAPVRLAAAIAMVAVVSVAALNIFGPGTGPGSEPTPTPSPSPTPTSLSMPADSTILQHGTYVAGDPFPVQITVDAPASKAWRGNIGGPYAVWLERIDGVGLVAFTIFDKVYADPCDYPKGPLDPLPGPTVDELASALASLPNLEVTPPTDVTFAGFMGKQLTLTTPDSFAGCTLAEGQFYRIWELPLGATNDLLPGQRQRVWILDVNGNRVVIWANEGPDDTALERTELQAILDSVRIDLISATPS
jgi:hypothetical protein